MVARLYLTSPTRSPVGWWWNSCIVRVIRPGNESSNWFPAVMWLKLPRLHARRVLFSLTLPSITGFLWWNVFSLGTAIVLRFWLFWRSQGYQMFPNCSAGLLVVAKWPISKHVKCHIHELVSSSFRSLFVDVADISLVPRSETSLNSKTGWNMEMLVKKNLKV